VCQDRGVAASAHPFLRALLAAGVAHGAVLATVWKNAVSGVQPVFAASPPAAAAELIEIDLPSVERFSDELHTESAVMIARDVTPSRRRLRNPSQRDGRSAFGTEVHLVEDPGAAGSVTDAAAPARTATESAAGEPSFSLEQLGLEGPNRLSLRTFNERPSATTGRPSSASPVDRSMRQLARDHDRQLGLGAGGPVATALKEAAYRANVTLDGQAVFKVIVIDNAVSAISLVPSGAEKQNAWNEVAKNALAQLAGRRVRGRSDSRGAVLHIQLVSRAALPSGHDPGIEISVGPFVVQRGRGKRSARLAFLEPAPMLTSAIDVRDTSGRPSPGTAVNLIGTDIDPADLGAKDRQVVHAYTIDETPLD
jgi:hypothetical protein